MSDTLADLVDSALWEFGCDPQRLRAYCRSTFEETVRLRASEWNFFLKKMVVGVQSPEHVRDIVNRGYFFCFGIEIHRIDDGISN